MLISLCITIEQYLQLVWRLRLNRSSCKTSLSMHYFRAQIGNLLAIASFAMLLGTQWMHSPLHHLVDEVSARAAADCAATTCSVRATTDCETHEHSRSHAHNHSYNHAHSHSDHDIHAHDGDLDNSHQSFKSTTGEPCHHGHHHPENHCHVCQFVAAKVGLLHHSIEVSGVESVHAVADSTQVIVDTPALFRQFVRGPPALA